MVQTTLQSYPNEKNVVQVEWKIFKSKLNHNKISWLRKGRRLWKSVEPVCEQLCFEEPLEASLKQDQIWEWIQ